MLRYREDLGLLPQVRDRTSGGRGPAHRQFSESDLEALAATLALERRYDISPASLAFGLRVLAEPPVRAAVADLGRRLGRIPAPASRALDFEKERALRALSRLTVFRCLRRVVLREPSADHGADRGVGLV